ncbi:uncharacterized protein LOC112493927 [Cephus cinctus]|uniref:Uncharacterized protein LOC112493927 n=1 Tax=Cephus cinctus TaxID=211228 RepID=A0AAJ7VYF2_CEPCN|nr:uncharacterized protein LOC112493927 [Cephus cinctus]
MKAHDTCMSIIVNEPFKLKEEDCNVKIISITHTMWIKFKNNNKWLYATPSSESIKIICNKTVEETIIMGTKILWIAPGRTIVSNDVILHSQTERIVENNKAFTPLITYNFSQHFQVFKDPQLNLSLIKIHAIETPDVKIGDLTKYGTQLNEITREAIEIGNHQRIKTFYEEAISWITYAIYILGGLVILYLMNKFKIFYLLKCLTLGAFKPCTSVYNHCLFNYGNNARNQNSCATEMPMGTLAHVNSSSISSNLDVSPIFQRKTISLRQPEPKRKVPRSRSRLRISEFDNDM